MGKKKVRLPTRATLPFDFIIRINQTSKAYMHKLVNAKPDEEPPVACWMHEDAGGTIWLLRCRSRIQKIEDLSHEVIHAANDWAAWLVAKERGE